MSSPDCRAVASALKLATATAYSIYEHLNRTFLYGTHNVPNKDVSEVKVHDIVLRTLSGNRTITTLRTLASVSTDELYLS